MGERASRAGREYQTAWPSRVDEARGSRRTGEANECKEQGGQFTQGCVGQGLPLNVLTRSHGLKGTKEEAGDELGGCRDSQARSDGGGEGYGTGFAFHSFHDSII